MPPNTPRRLRDLLPGLGGAAATNVPSPAVIEAVTARAEAANLGASRGAYRIDGGWLLEFERGWIAAVGRTLYLLDAPTAFTRLNHRELGDPAGDTGVTSDGTAFETPFAHGVVFHNADIGAQCIAGAMYDHWTAAGGLAGWGLPVTRPYATLERDARAQMFSRGIAAIGNDGAPRPLRHRLPAITFAFSLSLDPYVPGDAAAAHMLIREEIRNASGKIAVAGVDPRLCALVFEDDGVTKAAVWLHWIDEAYAQGQLTGLAATPPTSTIWRQELVREPVADAVAMALDAIDHRVVLDGKTVTLGDANLGFYKRSGGAEAILDVAATLHAAGSALDGRVYVTEPITYDPATGALASERSFDVDGSDALLTALALVFAPGSTEIVDAIAQDLLGNADLTIPPVREMLPFPIEVLIPGSQQKLRLAPDAITAAVNAPDRLITECSDLTQVLRAREPRLRVKLEHGQFLAVSADLRDPVFSWTFTWLPIYRPTGASVKALLPTSTHTADHCIARVEARDADGTVLAAQLEITRARAAGEPAPAPARDPRPRRPL